MTPGHLAELCGHTAIVTPADGQAIGITPVWLNGDTAIDRFYEQVRATAATIIQAIPEGELLICSVSQQGTDCTRQASHAVLTWNPRTDEFDQVTACPDHLAAAASVVVHGADTTAPRPRWN